MLFKTPTEFQEYISSSIEFEMKAIKPYLNAVCNSTIKNLLGSALLAKLIKAYDDNSNNANYKELLTYVRPVLANLAFEKYLPTAQVSISKGGVRISTNETNKTAFQWQIKDIRKSCLEMGNSAIEELLIYLESKSTATEFSDWSSAPGYTLFYELFLRKTEEFQKEYNINNSRRTFLSLVPMMREVEEFSIMPLIGSDFATELKTQIKANNVTANNKKAIALINKTIAYLTVSKATAIIPVRITADGLEVYSTGDRNTIDVINPASGEQLAHLKNNTESSGNTYLKVLNDLLYGAPDNYATWKNSSAYINPDTATDNSDQTDSSVVML